MTRETTVNLVLAPIFLGLGALLIWDLGKSCSPTSRQDVALPSPDGEENVPVMPHQRSRSMEESGHQARDGSATAKAESGPLDLIARRPVRMPVGAHATPPAPAPAPLPRRPTLRQYAVQHGDRLIDIAKKYYGPDNGHLYREILKANQNVLGGQGLLRPGQVLVIPFLAERPAAGHAAHQTSPAGGIRVPAGAPPVRSRTYRVCPGDNLTHIARKTLRDDSPLAVQRIIDANRGRIDDPDVLVVGLELVIPVEAGGLPAASHLSPGERTPTGGTIGLERR